MRLCTICARGGSKGLPKKNVRLLKGKPLIAWSILQAKATGLFGRIGVSSESDEILNAAAQAGADDLVKRPEEMATDVSSKDVAIHHAAIEIERRHGRRYNTLVDIDATAPLRLPEDIVGAVELLEKSGASSVITGCVAHRSPYFNLVERNADGSVQLAKQRAEKVVRRQDAPACFDMNASVYVWQRDVFIMEPRVFYSDTRLYEMPAARSRDIDDDLDFALVEFLFDRLGIEDALNRGVR